MVQERDVGERLATPSQARMAVPPELSSDVHPSFSATMTAAVQNRGDTVARGAPNWIHAGLDRFYQGFLEVVVFSSVWIAAGLASLTLFSAHVLGLPFDLRPALLVFFSGLFIYNLDHIADSKVEGIPDEYAAWFFQRRSVGVLLVGSAIATGLMVSMAPQPAKWAFGVYCSIGLLYGLPLVPHRTAEGWGRQRLKDIPGVKAWLVALAMTVGGLALPLGWTASRGLDATAWYLAIFMFVFNTHIFDVRDMENDRKVGVVSLPIQAGLKRTKMALVAMNLAVLGVMMWGWFDGVTGPHPEVVVCCALTVLYVMLVREDTPRDVYSILVDGCFFLPALLGLAHDGLH